VARDRQQVVGALALAIAAAAVHGSADLQRHALVLASGHVGLHTVRNAAIMLCYLAARVAADYTSPAHISERSTDHSMVSGISATGCRAVRSKSCACLPISLDYRVQRWLRSSGLSCSRRPDDLEAAQFCWPHGSSRLQYEPAST
jgi:hypothetical protein